VAKSQYVVERSAVIPAPSRAVFDLIVDFHRWTAWSPWEDIDPTMYRGYSGAASGVGAIYEWHGNRKAGTGRMEITEVDAPSRVQIALQFIKPFKSKSTTTFELSESGGSTNVTWRMVGPTTLATRVMGIFMSMDTMIGKDFEKGLAQLATAAKQ
jgi:uncharacterized protein YndB with AHSA1/START domain